MQNEFVLQTPKTECHGLYSYPLTPKVRQGGREALVSLILQAAPAMNTCGACYFQTYMYAAKKARG